MVFLHTSGYSLLNNCKAHTQREVNVVRGITFMTFPGFIQQYLSKEVTSVRVNTIKIATSQIINGSENYTALVSRIKRCLPDLAIHNSFDLTIWCLDHNQVVKISKEFFTPEPNANWYDITEMIIQMSTGMPVVAFEINFGNNAKPVYQRSLFIVI